MSGLQEALAVLNDLPDETGIPAKADPKEELEDLKNLYEEFGNEVIPEEAPQSEPEPEEVETEPEVPEEEAQPEEPEMPAVDLEMPEEPEQPEEESQTESLEEPVMPEEPGYAGRTGNADGRRGDAGRNNEHGRRAGACV